MLMNGHDGHAFLMCLDLGQRVVEADVPLANLAHQIAREELTLPTALHMDRLYPSGVLTTVSSDHGVSRCHPTVVDADRAIAKAANYGATMNPAT